MSDAMDDCPTVREQLAEAKAELVRLRLEARQTYGVEGLVRLHDTAEEALACRLKCAEEIVRLTRELAAGGNYVADRELEPTCVRFRNGRKVSLGTEVQGGRIVRAWLYVGRAATVELAQAEANDMLPDGDT